MTVTVQKSTINHFVIYTAAISVNIKSISLHPLLWINSKLDFMFMGCKQREASKKLKIKYVPPPGIKPPTPRFDYPDN